LVKTATTVLGGRAFPWNCRFAFDVRPKRIAAAPIPDAGRNPDDPPT
jgi:hypothetical protein